LFGSALHAGIWKGNRSDGCGKNNLDQSAGNYKARSSAVPGAPVLTELRTNLSFVGLFPHPVKINVPANKERLVSFADAAFNKITRKLRGVQIHQKNYVHSSINLKIVSRYKPAVNHITRIHSSTVAFYQLGPAHKIGALAPYRQPIGGAGMFARKDALATRMNGLSWKKIRSDSWRLERQLARSFRSMWQRDRHALRNR
jgi:hypothetical protein